MVSCSWSEQLAQRIQRIAVSNTCSDGPASAVRVDKRTVVRSLTVSCRPLRAWRLSCIVQCDDGQPAVLRTVEKPSLTDWRTRGPWAMALRAGSCFAFYSCS